MQEKAFNMVVSEHSTQCCVCSLFVNPSYFLSFRPQLVSDTYKKLTKKLHNNGPTTVGGERSRSELMPKPVTELRVVVQRVLINLPGASKDAATELSSRLSESDDDNDQLITCTSCGICVHKCMFTN